MARIVPRSLLLNAKRINLPIALLVIESGEIWSVSGYVLHVYEDRFVFQFFGSDGRTPAGQRSIEQVAVERVTTDSIFATGRRILWQR